MRDRPVINDLLYQIQNFRELSIEPDSVIVLGPHSYRAESSAGPVVLRFIPEEDVLSHRAIKTLALGHDGQFNILQPLRNSFLCEGGTIAVFDLIAGTTLRRGDRSELPLFFEKLALWHLSNAGAFPIFSRYTGLDYDSMSAFLEDELAYHINQLETKDCHSTCLELLKPLASGITTLIHGDVHPDNIIVRHDRTFMLLDSESLHFGCNFLDLDYVDWIGVESEEIPWWTIREHRFESVLRYFSFIGASTNSIPEVMTAVCLLTALRFHSNALKHEAESCSSAKSNIMRILGSLDKKIDVFGLR